MIQEREEAVTVVNVRANMEGPIWVSRFLSENGKRGLAGNRGMKFDGARLCGAF